MFGKHPVTTFAVPGQMFGNPHSQKSVVPGQMFGKHPVTTLAVPGQMFGKLLSQKLAVPGLMFGKSKFLLIN